MGFTTILDILGSMIIGGILLMILLNFRDSATERTYNSSGELTIQQNLSTIARIIEYDFRKIGFCQEPFNWTDPTKSIPFADSSSIRFYTDIDLDGNMDSIYYYLGPTSECSSTPNPRDRILYRVVNNEPPVPSNLGVTEFYMNYFDTFGNKLTPPVTILGLVSSIEIFLKVEDVAAYDENYSNAFWRQIRVASRNVSNR